MFKKIIQKSLKLLLSISLLFTGVLFTPTRINAEDGQPYAAIPTLSKKYLYNVLRLGTAGYAGTVELDVVMNLVTTTSGTDMTYSSATCTPDTSTGTTYCDVYDHYVYPHADYSTNYDNSLLIVEYYIKTVRNSTTYYSVYKFIYKNNAVYQQGLVKGPSTSEY